MTAAPPMERISSFSQAQEVIHRMQSSRDRGLGVFYNDCPFDESYEMLSSFMGKNEFFDHYSHDQIVDLLAVMDILEFNAKAPITKLGETSSWVGILLKGTVDVFVKGTKVGCIPTGAMIGDTGTIEGGKRSADCEGSEDGGVIALLRFDKMDMLHVKQPCLAYQLAMSFGGVVVRKLRQAMGKVFKKDNKARAGENIGKRRLMIETPLHRPDRREHQTIVKEKEDDGEGEGEGEGDDSNHSNSNEKETKEMPMETKIKNPNSKWNIVKKSVKSAAIFKNKEESKIGGLTAEEVLYLAREKKIRDPLSAEAEKKLINKCVSLENERDAALDEIERLRILLANATNKDKALVLEASIASASNKRYESLYITDHSELMTLQFKYNTMNKKFIDMEESLDKINERHSNRVKDLEDEIEFIRGREVLLGKKCRETEHEMKMVRIRMQAKVLHSDTYIANATAERKKMYETIDKLKDLLILKDKEKFMIQRNMTVLQNTTNNIINKMKLKCQWKTTAIRAVCKRLSAVRKVSKIHSAWFAHTTKSIREQHKETMSTVSLWNEKLRTIENELNDIKIKNNKMKSQVLNSNGKCSVLTVGVYLMMYRLLQSIGHNNLIIKDKEKLKKLYLKSEATNVTQENRTKKAYEEHQKSELLHNKRYEEHLQLIKDYNELKKKNESLLLKVNKHNDIIHKINTDNDEKIRKLNLYLIESDELNKSKNIENETLKHSLGSVVNKIFSSEIRRIELEKSFGHLSKPSKSIASLLKNDGFLVNVEVPIHHPHSSINDLKLLEEENKFKHLERNWNTPIKSLNRSRPQTAPHPNNPSDYYRPHNNGLPQVQSPSSNHLSGGSPLPRRAPPPYYPDDNETRRGLPEFDEGTSRTLSYWDNSRKQYIAGLTGKTSKSAKLKFWGTSGDQVKGKNKFSLKKVRGSKKHPLMRRSASKGETDRWYHQQFAQHYRQLGLNSEMMNNVNMISKEFGETDHNQSNIDVTKESNCGNSSTVDHEQKIEGSNMRSGSNKRPYSSPSGRRRKSKLNTKKHIVPTALIGVEGSGMLSGWDDATSPTLK